MVTESRSVVVWGQERGEGEKGTFFRVMEMSSVVIVTVVTQETISQVHQTVHLIICKLYFSKLIYKPEWGCHLEPRTGWTRILKEVGINICAFLFFYLKIFPLAIINESICFVPERHLWPCILLQPVPSGLGKGFQIVRISSFVSPARGPSFRGLTSFGCSCLPSPTGPSPR